MMRALFRRRAHNISFGTASIEGVADETEKQNHMHRHLPPSWRAATKEDEEKSKTFQISGSVVCLRLRSISVLCCFCPLA